MKKIIAIVMALLLCLSLLACNVDPKPIETGKPGETTGARGTEPTNEPEKNEPVYGFVEVPKPSSLPTSGWVTSSYTSMGTYALMDSGCYYLFNQCLYYLDTATGYSVGLCSKPSCLHGESTSRSKLRSCDAYIPDSVSLMFFHDGTLYYALTDPTSCELYARSQDGLELRKVGTLCSQYYPENTSAMIDSWVFSCGKLYYTAVVNEVTKGEDGTQIQTNTIYALAEFDVSTGKEEELLRSKEDIIAVFGANEGMVLFWMAYMPTLEDVDLEDYYAYINQFPAYLRLWHEAGGGVSTLCEADRTSTSLMLGFADGKMHLSGSGSTEIYAYDFASMTFGDSDLPADVNRIWSEKYGGVKWEGYYDLETGTYFTDEYATMQLPDGTSKFGASPRALGQRGFVVEEFYYNERIVLLSNFVYIPFEKLNDGFQLSDRILFMRREDGKGYTLVQPENG